MEQQFYSKYPCTKIGNQYETLWDWQDRVDHVNDGYCPLAVGIFHETNSGFWNVLGLCLALSLGLSLGSASEMMMDRDLRFVDSECSLVSFHSLKSQCH